MNTLFVNSYQSGERSNSMSLLNKKGLPYQSESLFGMALYDFDTLANDVGLVTAGAPTTVPPTFQGQPPIFHPVEEYKDLSLREILDLSSDDFLPANNDDEDQLLNPTELLEPVPYSSASNSHDFIQQPTQLKSSEQSDDSIAFNVEPQPSTVMSFNSKKRARDVSDDETTQASQESSTSREKRFRPYQAGQWSEKFQELCEYREKHGHCLVPHTYSENLALARWVKRQRYQYKLMMENKPSTMTKERVKALEDIGFVWDSQGAAWGERLEELEDFRKTYMHCNVPSNYSDNPRLATWIKCQRRQYKLYIDGKPSNMTPQRISHLESLGFEWELRRYKNKARLS